MKYTQYTNKTNKDKEYQVQLYKKVGIGFYIGVNEGTSRQEYGYSMWQTVLFADLNIKVLVHKGRCTDKKFNSLMPLVDSVVTKINNLIANDAHTDDAIKNILLNLQS